MSRNISMILMAPLLVLPHYSQPGVSVFTVVRSRCVKVRAGQVLSPPCMEEESKGSKKLSCTRSLRQRGGRRAQKPALPRASVCTTLSRMTLSDHQAHPLLCPWKRKTNIKQLSFQATQKALW